jgi:hypothetical protein
MTTLVEAHRRFADKLDELRRRHVAEYDVWLKSALGNDTATQRAARERLTFVRKTFLDEFLNRDAPDIVHALNPAAEQDIVKTLKSFEVRPEPSRAAAAVPGGHWLPSLWRTALAAAFGAVVGVILLALQPIGETPKPAPSTIEQSQGQVVTPAPTETAPAPKQPTEITITRDKMVLWLLAAAFVAAIGAAIGVLIVACPPVTSLLERMGLKGMALQWAKGLGGAFLFLRIGPILVLVAALLSGFFALIAWILGGSKPLHVLIGVTALATVVAARWTAPDARAQDRNAVHRTLMAQLDGDLRSDSNVWAALAAALVMKRNDPPPPPPDVRDVVNIIVSREKNNDPPPLILQVVKQRLNIGGIENTDSGQWPGEFVWKAEHEELFDAFGIVEAGDVVTVSTQPNVVMRPDGTKQVIRRGLVTRKSG